MYRDRKKVSKTTATTEITNIIGIQIRTKGKKYSRNSIPDICCRKKKIIREVKIIVPNMVNKTTKLLKD